MNEIGVRHMTFRIALLLTQIRDLVRRVFGPRSAGEDPYAGVRVPTRRSPSGRSSAIAVMAPREDDEVTALGGSDGIR